jgi:hypothetical protein
MLTLGLVAGAVVRKASWNAKFYEQAVAAATGLPLKIGSVESRTPTCVRLRDVTVLDTQTAVPLFNAPAVEWSFVSTGKLGDFFPGLVPKKKENVENRPSLKSLVSFFSAAFAVRSDGSGFCRLDIPQSELRFETLTREESARKSQELLLELITRYRKTSGLPIQVALERVDLRLRSDGDREQPLPGSVRFVQGNLYGVEESVRSDWTFQIPDVSEMETQRFSLEERKSAKGTEVVFRFSNRKEKGYPKMIPCELAGYFSSFFHPFNCDSLFNGEITAEYRVSESNPWTFRMTDLYLANLDVAQCAADYTSFPVFGNANVQIYEATFGDGVFMAAGWLQVQNGSIDRTFFRRLVENFALEVTSPEILNSSMPSIPFDNCVVSFRLTKDGATFWKDESNPPNLFMLCESRSPVMHVYLPNIKRPISYPAFLAAFAPDAAPIIPLTPGTQKIISTLPTATPTSKPSPATPLPMTAAPR